VFIVPFGDLAYKQMADLKEQCICIKLFEMGGKTTETFQMLEVSSCEEMGKAQGCQLFCEFKRCMTSVEGANGQNVH
jgi:hypothetical protein